MAVAQPLTAFQSPYASFAGLNASGMGSVSPYWPATNAGVDYNTSALMPQYYQWPSFSNLHTAHGAPAYGGVGFPPFAPSAGANQYYYPAFSNNNKEENDDSDEEKVPKGKSKKSSNNKYISEEEEDKSDEKRPRGGSEEEENYTPNKKREKSKKKSSKKASKYDKSEEEVHDEEEEVHSDVEHEEEEDYNEIVEPKHSSKKNQLAVRSAYDVPHQQMSGYGSSSSGGHAPADHTHVHYHKKPEEKDQSCFCTIGKVGYMEPSGGYGHSSGGGKGGNKGGNKDREELGYAIGIPVTAGILALITGVAAFLLTLAFQGVGREGSLVLTELKKKSPLFNRILDVHPLDKLVGGMSGENFGLTNSGGSFDIPELPPLPASTAMTMSMAGPSKVSKGSSAFAPHRNNPHMRMKRSFGLLKPHLPVTWYQE